MASLRPPDPLHRSFAASTVSFAASTVSFAASTVTLVDSDQLLGVKGDDKQHQLKVADVEARGADISPDSEIPSIPKPPVEVEGYRFYIIMFCLCMGNFLAYFTETAVMTSLRVIGNEFHDSSNQAWIATAYLLGFILPQLVIGRMCDIFGRSAVFNATMLIFAAATLWCGLSNSFASLIASRVFQGIGASGRQTVGSVMIIDLTTKHNRGTWLGFFNFALSLGLTFGLLIGGLITEHTTWRWSFWSCLIGIGVFSAIGLRFMYYPVPNRKQSVGIMNQLRDVDWIGTISAIIIAALICIPLELGVNNCPWSSAAVLAPLGVGTALILPWIYYETTYPANPVLEFETFSLRNIQIASVINFLVGSGYMGAVFFLPRFFTTIKMTSSLITSGVQLTGLTLGEGFTSALGGYLMCQAGQVRYIAFFGAMLYSLGSGLFLHLKTDSPVGLVILFSTFIGIGSGLLYQPASIAGPSSVKPHQVAAVASWLNFARSVGGIVHAAVLTAAFDAGITSHLGKDVSHEVVRQGLGLADNWQQYPEYIGSIANLLIQTFRVGAVLGIVSGIVTGVLVLLLIGLDFKPKWWIKKRLAQREARMRQLEKDNAFEPKFYPY